jgi:uncharacterized HAD superfamily protein
METINKIAVDSDDSLINFMKRFNEFHNKKYGTTLTLGAYTTYDLSLLWEMAKEKIRQDRLEFYNSSFYCEIERMEGAYEAVEYLSKERGFELSIVTARKIEFKGYLESTLLALFEEYHFKHTYHIGSLDETKPKIEKGDVCTIHGIPLLVDDYERHLIRAAKNGIHGILFRRPWNKHVTDLPKTVYCARGWEEVIDIIEEKYERIFNQISV